MDLHTHKKTRKKRVRPEPVQSLDVGPRLKFWVELCSAIKGSMTFRNKSFKQFLSCRKFFFY